MPLSATSLIFKGGQPVMAKHTETGTHSAGDVVVIGSTPFVAHIDVPQFVGGPLIDALSSGGGIYTGQSDGTPIIGQNAFYNPTTKKLTLTAAGNVHFGLCVAGPVGGLEGASPTVDGDLGDFVHAPRAVSPGLSGGKSEVTTSVTATLTAAQLLAGFINSAPAGAINLTLPTAAAMVAGAKGCKVGDSFETSIENTSGGANTITLVAGGATLRGGTAIAQNKGAFLRVLITNVTAAAEAYTVHSIIGA